MCEKEQGEASAKSKLKIPRIPLRFVSFRFFLGNYALENFQQLYFSCISRLDKEALTTLHCYYHNCMETKQGGNQGKTKGKPREKSRKKPSKKKI